ncbi:MAG: site-specific integrase [Desulfobacteraceae bacterium]|nr:site-specific integrase [Desulfobacteraceae bacterium]MBL7217410.1 site-specific integrase [Desulfobacteraceae bacterium]
MGTSIREKPKGSGEWWIFINHRGTRKAKKIGKNKKLARDTARKIEAKLTLGDLDMSKFNRKCPTLKEYGKMWLALPHDRKETTHKGYIRNLELHVYPVLGTRPIDQIKRKHIKGMFDTLLANGMATSNFQNIKAPLNGIFGHAVESEVIEHNPLIGLTFSKKRNIKITPLTGDQVFKLLDQVKIYREELFYPHILTLFRTGLRVGEMLGLQWGDIDFKERSFKVSRRIYHAEVGTPKSGKNRIVDMTPHLTDTLKELKVRRQKEALRSGKPFSEWVFTINGGNSATPPTVKKVLDECLEKAELPHMRIHDLRHTYATIRLLRGHDIGDVSYQLGHSSIKITFDTYTHWIPGNFKSQVDELDQQPNATYMQPGDIQEYRST